MRIPRDAESLSGYISDVCKERKQDDKAFIKVKPKIVADIIHFVKREKMSFIDTHRPFKPHMPLLLSRLIASGAVTFDDLRPLSNYISCSTFLYQLPNLTTSEAEEIGFNASNRISDAIFNFKSEGRLVDYLYDDCTTFTDPLNNYHNDNLFIERDKFNLVLKFIADLLDEHINPLRGKSAWGKEVGPMDYFDRPEIVLFLKKGFFNERFKETVIEMVNSPLLQNIIFEYFGSLNSKEVQLFRLLPSWDKKDTDRIWDVTMKNYALADSGLSTYTVNHQCDVINSLPVESISLDKVEATEAPYCNVTYAKRLLESLDFDRMDNPKLLIFVETMANMSDEVAYAVMSSPCKTLPLRILINATHTINQSVIAGNHLAFRSMYIYTLSINGDIRRFYDVMDMCSNDQRLECYSKFADFSFSEARNFSLGKPLSEITYYDGFYIRAIYGFKRIVESIRKGRIDMPPRLSQQNFDKFANTTDRFEWSFFDKFMN